MPSDCVHHWRLDEPDGGPAVAGRCKKCGAEKMFGVAEGAKVTLKGDRCVVTYEAPKPGRGKRTGRTKQEAV